MSSIDTDIAAMRAVIQRIATGPELSKDLSQEQAENAMRLVLEQKVDPVQAAIFLIALRMKRETDEENSGVLRAIRQASRHQTAAVDELVDIFEPYNGYIRSLPMSAFVPCVLAASGLPAYSHGVECVGPKYGVTQQQVYTAAGMSVSSTVQEAAEQLANPEIGWAYLSQAQFCPSLAALAELRHKMVKRSVLTTVEGMAGAIEARVKTHLVTGYVHKAYPRIYLELAKEMVYDSALVLRGVEGGIIPSLRQSAKFHRFAEDEFNAGELDPVSAGVDSSARAVNIPEEFEGIDGLSMSSTQREQLAEAVLNKGLAVLGCREKGLARHALIYSAAIILWHCGRAESLSSGGQLASQAIDSGEAERRFLAVSKS